MKKYLVDDAEYSVSAKGDGPILVFAHGFPFDGRIFDAVADRLASKFYCVVPDLRGFGSSTLGANGLNPQGAPRVTMGRYADDLTILASEIACELGRDPATEKIYLCGLSMGGYISLAFAARRPERLGGIIFCDSNASADSPEKAEGRLKLAEEIVAVERATEQVAALAESYLPNLLSPKTLETKPEVVEALRQTMLRQRPTGIAAAARGMAKRADSTALLPKIAVPTLVLGGADDALSPPSSLDAIAAAIPGACRATIPDAGHVASLENPDAFADAVLRWAESAL